MRSVKTQQAITGLVASSTGEDASLHATEVVSKEVFDADERFSVNTHQSKNYAEMFWSKISAKTMKTFFCEKFLIVPSFSFQPPLEF